MAVGSVRKVNPGNQRVKIIGNEKCSLKRQCGTSFPAYAHSSIVVS